MYLLRAFLIWLIIVLVESVHGTLRQIFLAPRIGDFPARRIAFFTGMMLIFLVTWLFIRWIRPENFRQHLLVGLMWSVLTLLFEFGLGFFVLGLSQARMFEDYDITRGGLMGFGLLFMVLAPLLATKLRGNGLAV